MKLSELKDKLSTSWNSHLQTIKDHNYLPIKFYMNCFLHTVPAPIKAADTIQKLCFEASDYHIKKT